jgi:hypothetical protein
MTKTRAKSAMEIFDLPVKAYRKVTLTQKQFSTFCFKAKGGIIIYDLFIKTFQKIFYNDESQRGDFIIYIKPKDVKNVPARRGQSSSLRG